MTGVVVQRRRQPRPPAADAAAQQPYQGSSSELHFEPREGQPPLLEFTSSPLQQDQKVGPLKNRPNSYRVWGMRGNSYGLVTVDIPEPGRGTVRFEVRTEANTVPVVEETRCASTWQISDLQY